jgi:hypothetical protein
MRSTRSTPQPRGGRRIDARSGIPAKVCHRTDDPGTGRAGFGWGSESQQGGEMMRHLPGIPELQCIGCGSGRFIPLTYPRVGAAKRLDTEVRPSAKCVTCGLCYFASPTVPILEVSRV